MDKEKLKELWKKEESLAHIKGWDFSHIKNRYEEEKNLLWDYKEIIQSYLKKDSYLLDYDTGGGEFLLSLNHPYALTFATEGYPPNVKLCASKLLPLGIHFKECSDPSNIGFEDESFDIIINRHGEYDPKEVYRLLKKDGVFITEQVGADNERDLVEMILPNLEKPFPALYLKTQKKVFKDAGFKIIKGEEAYMAIKFYDVGAFVCFARIIE